MSEYTRVPALQGSRGRGLPGRRLVVVSDADMIPSTYIHAQLGPARGPHNLVVV